MDDTRSMDKKQMENLIAQGLGSLGLEDCFLVDLQMNNKRVEVFLDSDEGITFKKCRQLSRFLEETLDEKNYAGGAYVLEVSSAGVGNGLKFPRQYPKNVGRKIEVKTKDGEKIKGTLSAADDVQIIVKWKEKEKQGKKKIIVEKEALIRYDNIEQAKIKISF